MLNFKSSVSKDWKKYNIIIKANSEIEAKSKLHKEGYSILTLSEVSEINIKGNKYLFEAYIWEERKKWTIVWDDIFKLYVKLVDDLKYRVISIYPEEYKENPIEIDKITNRIVSQYSLYKANKDKAEKYQEPNFENSKEKEETFYLEKKLKWAYENLDLVLVKIDNLLLWEHSWDISPERKEKLQLLKIAIIKVKNSTNISKIKEIWEKSLLKLWEIELSIYEQYKEESIKEEVKRTNKLLKDLWSNKSFTEKEKDFVYLSKNLFLKIKDFFKKPWIDSYPDWNKVESIDKSSDDYIKTILQIKKYEDKKRAINKELLAKSYYLVAWKNKKSEYENLLIKKSVFVQNIKLLNARLKWLPFSYTKLKKWYRIFSDLILKFLSFVNESLYYAIILCFISFVWVVISNYYFDYLLDFSKYSILYFILIQTLFILIFTIRWILSMIVNFAIFWFMVIFLLVNF